ncbi:60s ribosomal protein l14-1 [Quercus suber]|uniref:60s ribosomal protein l14-1 n=1 Tax=Quercus suber TaxID=58331 RepID=A0AAW0K003_QUESU
MESLPVMKNPTCNTISFLRKASCASLHSVSTPSDPGKTKWRFVEIGRVALVNYGKEYGRLVVIVDVVDQNRALVDAPDMVRTQMNLKRLSLTDIKIDIKRVPKKKTLVEAMEAADVKNKWESSSWGRKLIVQKRRASLNDFDRFKIMLAKIKRAGIVRQELAKLKKESAA